MLHALHEAWERESMVSVGIDSHGKAEQERKSRIYPGTMLTLPARHSRQESQTMAELQPEHCAAQSSPLLHRGGVKHSSPLLLNPKNRMLVEITKSTTLLTHVLKSPNVNHKYPNISADFLSKL